MMYSSSERGSVSRDSAVAILVETEDAAAVSSAERLSAAVGKPGAGTFYSIAYGPWGVELRRPRTRPGRGWQVDLSRIERRTATGNLSRKQPISRAVGDRATRIVDATAGFGHDAALLALMGYEVTAIERSPVVAVLLADGLRRARCDTDLAAALGDRLSLLEGDARAMLEGLKPDTVYLDPMYPQRRRASALPRGHAQALRAIVGMDDDSGELLAIARQAAERVVVKRPRHADTLGKEPAHSIRSKLVRYDVYL
jgi:16S rRNA (guanine1516-N2)-methyltransferase